MKQKMCLISVLVVLSLSMLQAQRYDIIPLSSSFYSDIDRLRIWLDMSPASNSRPFSRAEALKLVEELEAHPRAQELEAHILRLRSQLKITPRLQLSEEVSADAHLQAQLEGYARIDLQTGSFGPDADYLWHYNWDRRASLLNLNANLFVHRFLGLRLELDAKEDYRMVDNRFATKDSNKAQNNYTNVPTSPYDIDTFVPYRAYTVTGTDAFTVSLGRDKINWGNGQSGNLLFSQSMDYLDSLRFRIFSPAFNFVSLYSVIQEPEGTIEYTGFIAHRLEFRFWQQRISFAFTEAVSFGGENSYPNLIHDLNHLDIYHAWNLPLRTNSLMTAELGITVFSGLHIYGQFAMDEMKTGPEVLAADAKPNAFGWLFGARYSMPTTEGDWWSFWGEGVITDPWLYYQDNGSRKFPYRWRRYIWSFVDPQSAQWIVKPSGFWAGPDAISAILCASWERPDFLRLEARLGYLAKGEVDLTSEDDDYDAAIALVTPTGTPEHTISLNLNATWYTPLKGLRAGADLGWYYLWNKQHNLDQVGNDIEIMVYLGYSL